MREQIVLDFRKCRSIASVYAEMREKMAWLDWYGENPDALWDILTGLPCRGDDFVILRPRHYCGISRGMDAFITSQVDLICDTFAETQETYGDITVDVQYQES